MADLQVPAVRAGWALAATLGLVIVVSACSKTPPPATPKKQVNWRKLTFTPAPKANANRTFYVVIRAVDEKEFLTDSYSKISKLVFPTSKDPTVLRATLIWPKRKRWVWVDVPEGKAIGVYGLFTHPGGQWKLLLSHPLGRSYSFTLEQGNVMRSRKRKPRSREK